MDAHSKNTDKVNGASLEQQLENANANVRDLKAKLDSAERRSKDAEAKVVDQKKVADVLNAKCNELEAENQKLKSDVTIRGTQAVKDELTATKKKLEESEALVHKLKQEKNEKEAVVAPTEPVSPPKQPEVAPAQ